MALIDGSTAPPRKRTLLAGFLGLNGVLTVSIASAILILFFVYPGYRTGTFRKEQCDKPVICEIELDRSKGTTLSIKDACWIEGLDTVYSQAKYFRPNHPRKERECYLRVTRKSSRVDEYEVFLDIRGVEYDYFEVVHRSGNSTRFGSAFRAPGRRKLIDHAPLK